MAADRMALLGALLQRTSDERSAIEFVSRP
jgi:hypothetical protein